MIAALGLLVDRVAAYVARMFGLGSDLEQRVDRAAVQAQATGDSCACLSTSEGPAADGALSDDCPAGECASPTPPPAGQPRCVSRLTSTERDAVWQCEELAPTTAWNPLYRWNFDRWEYNQHGWWQDSVAGAADVCARTINPDRSAGLVVQFTEVPGHPDLIVPGAQSLTQALIPAICDTLVDHQMGYDPDAELVTCVGSNGAVHAKFSDRAGWREHVAPLIAARMPDDCVTPSLYEIGCMVSDSAAAFVAPKDATLIAAGTCLSIRDAITVTK